MTTFKILNNCAVRIVRNGLSMFHPNEFQEVLVIPFSKISMIQKVDSLITIELVSGSMHDIHHDTCDEANAQFRLLTDALAGVEQKVMPNSMGPAPDAWALEQLK